MNVALKEWAVVVAAMKQGQHHLLLRKGGIADKGQEFRMEHPRFLLFPTYEHQKSEMISEHFRSFYEETVHVQPSPENLVIEIWAEIQKSFVVNDLHQLQVLSSFHIWSDDYLKMRLDYKPEKPLFLLVLRTHRLKAPLMLKNLPRYGGCRSWVPLSEEVSTEDSVPVLSDEVFQKNFDSLSGALLV